MALYKVTYWKRGVRPHTAMLEADSESALGHRLASRNPGWTFDVERARNPTGFWCAMCGRTHRKGSSLYLAHNPLPATAIGDFVAHTWGQSHLPGEG